MKPVYSILFIFVVILCTGSISGCRKDANETAYTRLEGKWKLVQQALDDNDNGSIDGNEIHATDPAIVDVIQFKADSTGVETVAANADTTVFPFRYTING